MSSQAGRKPKKVTQAEHERLDRDWIIEQFSELTQDLGFVPHKEPKQARHDLPYKISLMINVVTNALFQNEFNPMAQPFVVLHEYEKQLYNWSEYPPMLEALGIRLHQYDMDRLEIIINGTARATVSEFDHPEKAHEVTGESMYFFNHWNAKGTYLPGDFTMLTAVLNWLYSTHPGLTEGLPESTFTPFMPWIAENLRRDPRKRTTRSVLHEHHCMYSDEEQQNMVDLFNKLETDVEKLPRSKSWKIKNGFSNFRMQLVDQRIAEQLQQSWKKKTDPVRAGWDERLEGMSMHEPDWDELKRVAQSVAEGTWALHRNMQAYVERTKNIGVPEKMRDRYEKISEDLEYEDEASDSSSEVSESEDEGNKVKAKKTSTASKTVKATPKKKTKASGAAKQTPKKKTKVSDAAKETPKKKGPKGNKKPPGAPRKSVDPEERASQVSRRSKKAEDAEVKGGNTSKRKSDAAIESDAESQAKARKKKKPDSDVGDEEAADLQAMKRQAETYKAGKLEEFKIVDGKKYFANFTVQFIRNIGTELPIPDSDIELDTLPRTPYPAPRPLDVRSSDNLRTHPIWHGDNSGLCNLKFDQSIASARAAVESTVNHYRADAA